MGPMNPLEMVPPNKIYPGDSLDMVPPDNELSGGTVPPDNHILLKNRK